MEAVEFKGQNVVMGKDQPQYRPLPALRIMDEQGQAITCWEVSDEELEEIIKTRRIYLSQLTFNQPLQPVMLASGLDGFVQFIQE